MMSIVNILVENAGNIAMGIGTGVISSIFVSKIFLIYQNMRSDFVEARKNTVAIEACKDFFEQCYTYKFKGKYVGKLKEEDATFVEQTYEKVDKIVLDEINNLNHVCTKYMDEVLADIIAGHKGVLLYIHFECDKEFRSAGRTKILNAIEGTINAYDEYQKKMFERTLSIIFRDKLIISICVMLFILLAIACIGGLL